MTNPGKSIAERLSALISDFDKFWNLIPVKEEKNTCDHGVIFDEIAADKMTVTEIRKFYPRLFGVCPKGCGYNGIAYASSKHYYSGDW